MSTHECDLLVVGGGPAGLSAAINGASEGIDVCLLDSGMALGGQAKESAAIENYPGFVDAVTGEELMGRMVRQARKFCTNILAPHAAASLEVDGHRRVITTDDYQRFAAKAVLICNGLNYRRHPAKGLGPLMGRGVYYGKPVAVASSRKMTVGVIGGANSAGQAAIALAGNPNATVKMIVRRNLEAQMSTYLVERITRAPNIEVITGAEVSEVHGREKLQAVTIERENAAPTQVEMSNLFIFIGAVPKTMWVSGRLMLDEKNFIRTGIEVGARYPLMTSTPGVFAAGDVRSGSIKRIAHAVGEGAAALQTVHAYLAEPVERRQAS